MIFSEATPKGSDCYDQFSAMQECFARYPTVYNKSDDDEDDDDVAKNKDTENLFGSLADDNNVDTVDQIDESSKTAKSDSSSNSVERKQEVKK